MKRLFFVMAAVAAMVGCSKENAHTDVVVEDNFTINASILTEDTRVTVGGAQFTEVSWVEGDKIRVESAGGFDADLVAESSGRENIRFVCDAYPVAATDTYYAVYPSSNISNATVTFFCDKQPGDDVAALVAKAENAKSSDIKMTFKPVNALLHVSVSGVSSLTKAEFKSYTGKTLPETFTYYYADDTVKSNYPDGNSRKSYEIEKPSVGGFFFSLPADLDMLEGYVITLTDANGNVCSKAYQGKTFAKATTTRVDFEWSTPSVTLGAKTSYSYYLAGDSETANSCANTDIFFVTGKKGESCASSYAGVQDAMITDLGYEIDGTTVTNGTTFPTTTEYKYSAGQVEWDKANNKFCLKEEPTYTKTLGEKSGIKAFIVVNGKKYYSTNNLWLTGLPYGYNFVNGSLDAYRNAGWTLNGSLRVADQGQASDDKLVLYSDFVGQKANGYIVSPKFYVPATGVNVQPQLVRYVYASIYEVSQTGYVGAVSSTNSKNTSSVSVTDKGSSAYGTHNNKKGVEQWLSSFQINSSNPYISISCTNNDASTAICHYFLFEAHFRYAE